MNFLCKHKHFSLALLCLLTAILGLSSPFNGKNGKVLYLLVFSVLFLGVYWFYFGKKQKSITELLFLIFAIGFILRVLYIQQTPYMVRQHDVGTLSSENTHLAYIMRLFNGEGMPQKLEWQFYQPPIWHCLCAVWLKIQSFFGVPLKLALENLQVLSLFLSSSIMLAAHRLFKLLGLKGKGMLIAFGIIAVHPSFLILSGSINNDILSLALALFAIVFALEWYKNPSFYKILQTALALGVAMGTKLSAGLCAVGIGLLFCLRLFQKGIKNRKSIFCQLLSFGGVCAPVALWWPLRNMLLFDKPLTYVPSLSLNSNQYIGFRSVFERLFDFSSLWENGVYPARVLGSQDFTYFEHNIPLGALKSSVFGEYYIGQANSICSIFAVILFYSAALLAICSVVCGAWQAITALKSKSNRVLTLYPLIIWATYLLSYVKFCFDYPHFCTMDFRYIALTAVFGALYIGLCLCKNPYKNTTFGKIFEKGCILLTLLFALSTGVLYLTIA